LWLRCKAARPLLDALAQASALDFNAWLAPAVQSALLLGAAPHNNSQHT
jgi:hypothetical protein